MSVTLRVPSDREALVDPGTGLVTRSWFLFFAGVVTRLGGVLGPTVGDAGEIGVGEGSPELSAALFSLAQEFAQSPYPVPLLPADDQSAELQSLRDQVAELTKEVQAIRSGTFI